MMKPTIHFTETMSGEGKLFQPVVGKEAIILAGYLPPEDQRFVQNYFLGSSEGRRFVMDWRDLEVAVSTTERSSAGGMRGKIERGVITVAGLADQPLVLEMGEFELLPEVAPGQRRMRYQLYCRTTDDTNFYTLYGFKQVERMSGSWRLWALWQDTTTLFVTIYDDGPKGEARRTPLAARSAVIGAGIIRIYPLAFAKQLLTFRSTGVANLFGHIANYIRFFRFFSGSLLTVYFGPAPKTQTQIA